MCMDCSTVFKTGLCHLFNLVDFKATSYGGYVNNILYNALNWRFNILYKFMHHVDYQNINLIGMLMQQSK